MINRIIAPELLELIEQGDAATLLDAVENVHPAEMADSCIDVVDHVDRMATKHTQGEPAQPVVSNASVQTKPASVREILGASMRRCAAQGLRFLARQEFDQMTIDIGQPAPPPQLGVLRQPRFQTVLKMHAGSAPAAENPGVACQGFPVRTICFRSDNSPVVITAVSDRSVCFFCRTCCCWFLDFGRRFSELDRPI